MDNCVKKDAIAIIVEKNTKQQQQKKYFNVLAVFIGITFSSIAIFFLTKNRNLICTIKWEKCQQTYEFSMHNTSKILPFFIPNEKWHEAMLELDNNFWKKNYYLNDLPRTFSIGEHRIEIFFSNTTKVKVVNSKSLLYELAKKIDRNKAKKEDIHLFELAFKNAYATKKQNTSQTRIYLNIK